MGGATNAKISTKTVNPRKIVGKAEEEEDSQDTMGPIDQQSTGGKVLGNAQ